MDLTQIAQLRLINQHIGGEKLKTIKELVAWMGAMQAQDALMMKWAVGVRLPGTTEKTVEAALDDGDILRTHLLRPTWHLVSQADIYWMLELTAPRIKSSMKSRYQELGLTESVISKSNSIIEKALSNDDHLLREELVAKLNTSNIATDNNRASHLFACAELDGIICSGRLRGGKQTYALLEKRAPKTKPLPREKALARLARIYFTSHGPATVKDFSGWAGLSKGIAAGAVESLQADLISETIEGNTYWFRNDILLPENAHELIYLLPAFDEFIISYQDRSAALLKGIETKAIIGNGMFKPVVVVGGQVVGVWKRTFKKNRVLVEIKLFKRVGKTVFDRIEEAAVQYGLFLDKNIELIRLDNE